jgi:Ca2+-binding EF-hand superfamily protein
VFQNRFKLRKHMKYNELVAISGLSGLFQLLSTKSDGAIVRNLEDQATKFVPARLHNVTPLDSIEVFTETDNIRLYEVFMEFLKNEASAGSFDISKADNKAIKNQFGKLFPAYDKDRVYVSDMKKMIKWFALLKKLDLLKAEEVTPEEVIEEKVEEPVAAKPAKKAAKKAAPKEAKEGEAVKAPKKAAKEKKSA